MTNKPLVDPSHRVQEGAAAVVATAALSIYQERLKAALIGYAGPETIILPAGETLAEYFAAHPELPAQATWTLQHDREVRFRNDVTFTLLRPTKA
jgi:hypothetical protein